MRRTRGQNIPSSRPFFRFVIVHRQAVASPTYKRFGSRIAPPSRPGPARPGPARPGPAPRLDAAGDQRLLACLRAQPDATLAEIGLALVAAGGPSLQRTAVWQAVERLGWGRKKKHPRR